MPVLVDGVAVGDTVAHSYILKLVTPGSHTITSKSENDATRHSAPDFAIFSA